MRIPSASDQATAAAIGLVAAGAGVVVTWYALPESLLSITNETWRSAAWVFLNANDIPIEVNRGAISGSGFGNVIAENQQFRYLRALPFGLMIVAGVLAAEHAHSRAELPDTLLYSGLAVVGYLLGLISIVVLTNALPTLSWTFLIVGGGLAAIAVGSRVLDATTGGFPTIAVTSLGTVALIGIIVIVTGAALVDLLLPATAVAGGGSAVGGFLIWMNRNAV